MTSGPSRIRLPGLRVRPRRRRPGIVLPLLQLCVGLFLGLVLFDRILMPLAVRHGSDEVIPDLRGRSLGDAERLLAGEGLEVGVADEIESDEKPRGTILAHEPPPGARVRKGRRVRLLVSSGARVLAVPPLAGQTVRSASIALADLGLQAGGTLLVPAPLAEGVIVASRPGPGEAPLEGGRVDLVVSRGRGRASYVMPDLVGLTSTEARARLSGTGIQLDHGELGRISMQKPSPGSLIRSGETVHLD